MSAWRRAVALLCPQSGGWNHGAIRERMRGYRDSLTAAGIELNEPMVARVHNENTA